MTSSIMLFITASARLSGRDGNVHDPAIPEFCVSLSPPLLFAKSSGSTSACTNDNVYFTLTDGTTLTVPLKSEELIRLYNEAKNLVSRFQHQTYIYNKNTNDKLVDIVLND